MKVCAKKFEVYLDSKNYNYHVYADDSEKAVIGFPYSGREVKCFFTGDDGEYLSLYMVYENVSEDKMVQALVACNELNAKTSCIPLISNRTICISIAENGFSIFKCRNYNIFKTDLF